MFLLPEMEIQAEKQHLEEKQRERHHMRLSLNTFTPDQWKTLFHFEKDDLCILCSALCIPEEFVASNRTRCTGIELGFLNTVT